MSKKFYIALVSPVLIKILSLNDKSIVAMSFWPVIIFTKPELKENKKLLNHELIHHKQQIEMLIVIYHLFYFVNFFIGLIRYKNWFLAYKNVCFEKEAYANERNLNYLTERKPMAWTKYI